MSDTRHVKPVASSIYRSELTLLPSPAAAPKKPAPTLDEHLTIKFGVKKA